MDTVKINEGVYLKLINDCHSVIDEITSRVSIITNNLPTQGGTEATQPPRSTLESELLSLRSHLDNLCSVIVS